MSGDLCHHQETEIHFYIHRHLTERDQTFHSYNMEDSSFINLFACASK